MDNPRAEKVAVVDEVRARLSGASAAILTEYRGLKVGELAALRRTLRDAGGEYRIYKNTLVRFAARDLGLGDLEHLLVGPTAIAFVDGDAAGVAKALRDYARTHPTLIVKGGVLGDKLLTAADAGALAELPSRDTLLTRLAGGLQAPLVQLAGLLQALPRNLAYGLKALVDQRAAAEPVPAAAPAAPDAEPEVAAPEAGAEPLPESPAPDATAEAPPAPEAEHPGDEPETSAEPLVESPAPDATTEAPDTDAPDTEPPDTEPPDTEPRDTDDSQH